MPSTSRKPLLPYEIVQLGVNDGGLGIEVVRRTNEEYRGNKRVVLDASGLKKGQPISHSNTFRRYAWIEKARELEPDLYPLDPILSEAASQDGKLPHGYPTCEELGIIICNPEGRRYPKLAKHLIRQLADAMRIRGGDSREEDISTLVRLDRLAIYDLKTVKDKKFPQGLRLDLGDYFRAELLTQAQLGYWLKGYISVMLTPTTEAICRLLHDGEMFFTPVKLELRDLAYPIENSRISFVKWRGLRNLDEEKRARRIRALEERLDRIMVKEAEPEIEAWEK